MTLAYQLARMHPYMHNAVSTVIQKHHDIAQKSLSEQWKHLIMEPLAGLDGITNGMDSVLVVLDALDECEDEQDFELILQLFTQAKNLREIWLGILITSRPETPIRYGFDDISPAEHRDFVSHDIQINCRC